MTSSQVILARHRSTQSGSTFLEYSFLLLFISCSAFNMIRALGRATTEPLAPAIIALESGGGSDSTSTTTGGG